jgi:hypothetical protein
MGDVRLNCNEANATRLFRLLIGKGTEALRQVFDRYHPPSTLTASLAKNKTVLLKLGCRTIKKQDLDLLFPVSGNPDSKTFDIILLSVLLKHICSDLESPETGWSDMPLHNDRSQEAVVQIKYFRNTIFAHATQFGVSDTEFENLWREISQALVDIGVPKDEIEKLRIYPVTFDFFAEEKEQITLYCPHTRSWLMTEIWNWFSESEPNVFVLTAGPGFCKTDLAAEIRKKYEESLAACYLYHQNSHPIEDIIVHLASQLCYFVVGYKEKILKCQNRLQSGATVQDTFETYLKEPLEQLPQSKPMLVMLIDGLDECESDEENELLDVVIEEFSKLPPWLKVLVTSRTKINPKKFSKSVEYVITLPDDEHNEADIKQFLTSRLVGLPEKERNISLLTAQCKGSFLAARYVLGRLQKFGDDLVNITKEEIERLLPEGPNSVFRNYFTHLEKELKSRKKQLVDIPNLLVMLLECKRIPFSEYYPFINAQEMREIIGKVNTDVIPLLNVPNDRFITVLDSSVFDWISESKGGKHEVIAIIVHLNFIAAPNWSTIPS